MKQELIKMMIEKKRLKLTFWQTIGHYSIVFLLLFISGITACSLIEIYITKNYEGVRSTNELITSSLPFFIIAIIFYLIQRHRLTFSELKIRYTENDFEEALKRTTEDLEWKIEIYQKKIMRAIRPSNWTGSWGEMITIIKDGDRLLLNSICDPNKISSIASFGWNRKNIRTFLSNLSDAINQVPPKQIITFEIRVKEWTLKKIFIRFIIYSFCLFLIISGIYMIAKPLNYRSQGAGIGAIIIASLYLYADIKIIVSKK